MKGHARKQLTVECTEVVVRYNKNLIVSKNLVDY